MTGLVQRGIYSRGVSSSLRGSALVHHGIEGAEQEVMIKATDQAAVFEELGARTSW